MYYIDQQTCKLYIEILCWDNIKGDANNCQFITYKPNFYKAGSENHDCLDHEQKNSKQLDRWRNKERHALKPFLANMYMYHARNVAIASQFTLNFCSANSIWTLESTWNTGVKPEN